MTKPKTLNQHHEDMKSLKRWLPINRAAVSAVTNLRGFSETLLCLLDEAIDAYDAEHETRKHEDRVGQHAWEDTGSSISMMYCRECHIHMDKKWSTWEAVRDSICVSELDEHKWRCTHCDWTGNDPIISKSPTDEGMFCPRCSDDVRAAKL